MLSVSSAQLFGLSEAHILLVQEAFAALSFTDLIPSNKNLPHKDNFFYSLRKIKQRNTDSRAERLIAVSEQVYNIIP